MKDMKSKKNSKEGEQASRRAFTKSVAATLLSAPIITSLANAQTPPANKSQSAAPPNPLPSPTPAAQKPSPVAEAYAEVARARFGDKVTPEQLEQIKKDLDGNVRTADRLRSVNLQNGDEPDFIFSA